MPTRNKDAKRAVKHFKKVNNILVKQSINDKDECERLNKLLGIACQYCNNLENHLKSQGYNRKKIEDIKKVNLLDV